MEHFAVGLVSVVFAVALPVVYLFSFQARRLGAWSKRQDGPKDRVWFFLLLFVIVGFCFGSFAQPLWDTGVECQAAGQPLVSCVFSLR
ncbi:hypothetical protein ACMHYJ_12390 [Castellaniella hirudinis]|uniref:hypothetical protein n=1 Tax=Castellaniella hirudinis TaxID=1144617 RepID=UPI0039C4929C